MKRFNYNEIKNITISHMEFNNGIMIDFEECRNQWALENNLKINETKCIEFRNIGEKQPCFLFCCQPKIEVFSKN